MTSAVRVSAAQGTPPWGAWFLGAAALGVASIGLLHLDHLPITMCLFKMMTGLPCPTCGTTRALGRLFALDVPGAFAMNPLATLGVFGLLAWGLGDLLLLTARRSVSVEVSEGVGRALRIAAVAALILNWAFLIVAGR